MGAAASLSSLVITPLGVPSSVVVLGLAVVVVLVVLSVVRNGRTGALSLSVVAVVVTAVVVVVVVDDDGVDASVVVICCLEWRVPSVPSVTGLTKSSKFI